MSVIESSGGRSGRLTVRVEQQPIGATVWLEHILDTSRVHQSTNLVYEYEVRVQQYLSTKYLLNKIPVGGKIIDRIFKVTGTIPLACVGARKGEATFPYLSHWDS